MANLTFVNVKTGELFSVDKNELKIRRRQTMRANIIKESVRAGLCYFVTLTLNQKRVPLDVCDICLLHRIWDRFLKRLRRRLTETRLSYVTIIEQHKSGWVHLHVLMNNCADQKYIKEAWLQCGGGLLCHVSVAKIQHVKQLAFYVTKSLANSRCPGKMVTSSRDIKLRKPKRSEGDWIIEREGAPSSTDNFDDDKCIHGYPLAALETYLQRAFKLADDGFFEGLFRDVIDQDINILNKEIRLIPTPARTKQSQESVKKRHKSRHETQKTRKKAVKTAYNAKNPAHKALKRPGTDEEPA